MSNSVGPPLRRNRDFVVWQAGSLLSTTGSEAAAIAYPLLVLAVTGSPALAGLVSFARVLPGVLLGPFAGVLADRINRKLLMVLADAVRAVASGGLVVAIAGAGAPFWPIPVVAAIEGGLSSLFNPAAAGMLRSIVPAPQLAGALAAQQARSSVARLCGPAAGGGLYAVGRALPFLADALSFGASMLAIGLVRTPSHVEPDRGRRRMRGDLAEGWRFLWGEPFLRTTTFLYGLTNPLGPALLLAVVVVGAQQGVSTAVIGASQAVFSAALLLGALGSGLLRRRCGARTVMLLELCAWPVPLLFVVWPNAYVLAASMLPVALAIPVTDSVVNSRRLAVTPDRLVGRVESARSTVALALTPFGALLAGALLDVLPARWAVLCFAGAAVPLALWGAASTALRRATAPAPVGLVA